MNRIVQTSLVVFVFGLIVPTKAEAAIVSFMGELSSGSGVLGPAPPSTSFLLSLDFTAKSPGFGTINSGTFSSGPDSLQVSGGDILLIDNGANDQALFSINTSGPAGSLAVTFQGNAISNNFVTTENLVTFINAAGPSTISADFGASGNYTGRVTSAVPEPGSAMLLSAAGVYLAFRRRRRARRCRARTPHAFDSH